MFAGELKPTQLATLINFRSGIFFIILSDKITGTSCQKLLVLQVYDFNNSVLLVQMKKGWMLVALMHVLTSRNVYFGSV